MNWRSRSSLAWRSANACSSRSSMRLSATPTPADLGALVGRLDAVGEVAAGDPARGVADAVERQQADAHDHPGDGGEHEQDADDHEPLDEQQAVERLVDLGERHGDDRDLAWPERGGDDAVAGVVAALPATVCGLPTVTFGGIFGEAVDVLAVVEDDRVGTAPLGRAARRRCRPAGRRRGRRRAAGRRGRSRSGSSCSPMPRCGERARDRAGALARLLVGAVEQERALLRVGDRREREQADRGDGEHGGQQPRAQRRHHARGVRSA